MPELDGDAEWRRIIDDPRPSSALKALISEIDAQMKSDPSAFPEMNDEAFAEVDRGL
jgi:hypothetical protein